MPKLAAILALAAAVAVCVPAHVVTAAPTASAASCPLSLPPICP